MYSAIHSYDRYFAQAARLQEGPAAPAVESSPAKEGAWHLVGETGRCVRFALVGDTATVTYTHGRCTPKQRTMSRECAREDYRKLLAAGFKPW